MQDQDLVVGLDIGTTKICAVIGEYDDEGNLIVSGLATLPALGLRKGMVANIEETTRAIADVISAAEQEAGRTVTEVIVGITANGIEGINSTGVVAVTGREKQISRDDISRVVEAARAIAVPMDREILHVLPQRFLIDGHQVDRDPLGMMGVRLEAHVHLITGSIAISENLIRCVNKSGYIVKELVLGAVASYRSVLSTEEREMGVLFIDIGGETTDFFVIHGDAPYYTGVLPVGSNHVTSDISYIFKTPSELSEMLKRESACCYEPLIEDDEPVIIPGVAGRPPRSLSRKEISQVVQPRMEELFHMIRKSVVDRGLLYKIGGGVVLTGGGSELSGAAELAQVIFNQPVRMGSTLPLPGLGDSYRHPAFSSTVGLLLYGNSLNKQQGPAVKARKETPEKKPLKSMVSWLKEFF